MSFDTHGLRALYTQISIPNGKYGEEDAQTYDDRVRQAENLMNQNFMTIQQQIGDIALAVASLQEWARQFN
ncbi:MAG: hypothetical protein LBS18_05515 [Clostridiales bacterium]|jgi:hypothetical protein|nr:hypothetical protein [Clostridiales bacterium]